MPRVAFSYPESAESKWTAVTKSSSARQAHKGAAAKNEYLGNLDFGYRVTGNAPFKPTRVYNDGVKTIIEMPPSFSQGEAPTLLVVRESGSMFRKNDEVMVNYRVQDGRYIVDAVFEHAVLVSGVGNSQRKITIERRR
jgi:type IV secretion system protein VirB9